MLAAGAADAEAARRRRRLGAAGGSARLVAGWSYAASPVVPGAIIGSALQFTGQPERLLQVAATCAPPGAHDTTRRPHAHTQAIAIAPSVRAMGAR